ncbi:hypothetical protein HL653_11345 [Sphingomonas sp. AP4-R1]|uniref:hypothetical protein n=1 Tax=Sphingomonas sp. AP4-R1 TaxID=2735134 RepID=UPI00149345C3|nr:hypothetical protein [Sphingomonas sp. AP4-R1]QJU58297.1 hypothetical protein HL653_11345 [Sphingomonas sp. AP4-R1]
MLVKRLMAASVASALAYVGSGAMPFQITALMRRDGLGASAAGMFGFFEILSFALVMMIASRLLGARWLRSAGLAGALGCLCANLILATVGGDHYAIWTEAAFLGASQALLGRAYVCTAAASDNPDRMFLLASALSTLIIVSLIATIPFFGTWFGDAGVFLAYCAFIVVLSPCLFMLPRSAGEAAHLEDFVEERRQLRFPVFGLMAIALGMSLAVGMAWSFSHHFAELIRMSEVKIALIDNIGLLSGVAALVAASLAAGRLNTIAVLAVAVVGAGGGAALICLAQTPSVYAIAVVINWIFASTACCWIPAASAELDRTGQAATLCSSAERIGYAFGAPFGGFILDHASHQFLAAAAFLCCVTALPFSLPRIARDVRASAPGRSASTAGAG